MPTNIDLRQVWSLTRFTLKSEWRAGGLRAMGRKRKNTKWWVFWNTLSYLVLGGILSRFYRGNISGDPFLLANAIIMTYVGIIAASNIFLSFGSGFLSPEETKIITPLPVSSETFFFSRLSVLLTYTTIISICVAIGPAIAVYLFLDQNLLVSVALMGAAILSGITSGLTVIVLYGLLFMRVPQQKMTKIVGYAQFAGSLVTTASIVILSNLHRGVDLARFSMDSSEWLLALPGVWFAALVAMAASIDHAPIPLLALAALIFLALMSGGAHVLLGKTYQSHVSDLVAQAAVPAYKHRLKREPFLFRWFSGLLGSHEARAVLMLFRAQFRFDARFRMSLLSVLPLTLIYLVVAVVSGGVADPFVSGLKEMVNAQLLYMIALLMPLMLLQSISQSDSYKSSWIFFVSPLDRAKLLLSVRNTLLAWVVVPYLLIIAAMFCFFMPVLHAILHVMVLGALAIMIFQLFLMIAPKMPFAQQRKPNRNNLASVIGITLLSGGSIVLLALEVKFGYRSMTKFALSFALILTLSLLLEQGLKARLRSKLSNEEFEA
jgi:ABC-2 type transport system permease protein